MSRWLSVLILLALLVLPSPVQAQSGAADQPVYIVQSGDSLNSIAARFGVSPVDLADANGISDPNLLAAGTPLIIPGLTGVTGVLDVETVPFGETLTSLSRRRQISPALMISLNRIISPVELYAGANLILPQVDEAQALNGETALHKGQSLLEAAVLSNTSTWSLVAQNELSGSWTALPGERLYFKNDSDAPVGVFLPPLQSVKFTRLPLVQGKTVTVEIDSQEPVTLGGTIAGNDLHFFPNGENRYVALQGIHAMAKPGLYPISLIGTLQDGSPFAYEQMVLLKSGFYPEDPPLTVPPETLDPKVTKPEDDLIHSLTQPISDTRLWEGLFKRPVGEPECIKSWYGDRRSYNGSDYTYFHTGLDYGYCALVDTLSIYAPAPGIVVYTGELTVRGKATVIDHGWGVYTGYWHQSEIQVKVGDRVETGQVIGQIGGTGRVNGPHLHWEIWVNGIQVDPEDWLVNEYPAAADNN